MTPHRHGLLIHTVAACALVAASAQARPRQPSARTTFDQMPGNVGATSVTSFDDNGLAWVARWRQMSQAKRTIDASYFIVAGDVFGLAFLAHLYERARQGVEVRLLLDGRGSAAIALPLTGLDDLQELTATGNVDIRIYNPPLLQLARTALEMSVVPISAGTHDKILVVDDGVAIVGGRNIAAPYFSTQDEEPGAVIDADVKLSGAAAAALAEVVRGEHARWFQERIRRDAINLAPRDELLRMLYAAMNVWLNGDGPALPGDAAVAHLEAASVAAVPRASESARAALRPLLQELVRVRSIHGALRAGEPRSQVAEAHVIASRGRADEHDDAANDAIVRSIATARHRVWIQSPYFMMTPRLLGALERAAARGVEIIAVTNGPSSSDNDPSQALFIDTWPELEARVPTLRVFAGAGPMLHTKRVLIDDALTLIGSHNLDPLSAQLNSEVVVAVWSRAINHAAQVEIGELLDSGRVYEYRIRRGADGRAQRDADGSVIVTFGPRHHLSPRRLEELRALKRFLLSVRGIWDLEFVAW